MSPQLVLLESQVLPGVDLVDLVSKDEGEELEEDTSFKEDPSMDKEDPITEPEFMKEDAS